jgi:hypothetical protein
MANGTSTTYMGLTKWAAADTFDYEQLATNFETIDRHNHTGNGKGLQIPIGGIAPSAVGNTEIANLAIDANKIQTGVIDATKLASGVLAMPSLALTNSLPTTGLYDGYTIDYTDNVSVPTYIWKLRYATVDNKWRFVGGNSIFKSTTTSVTTTTSTPDWDFSGNLSVTLPFEGKYSITYSASAEYSGSQGGTYASGVGFGIAIYTAASVVSGSGVYVNNSVYNTNMNINTATGTIDATVGSDKVVTFAFNRQAGPTALTINSQSLRITPISIS